MTSSKSTEYFNLKCSRNRSWMIRVEMKFDQMKWNGMKFWLTITTIETHMNLIEISYVLSFQIKYQYSLIAYIQQQMLPIYNEFKKRLLLFNYINETAVETVSQHNKYTNSFQLLLGRIGIGLFIYVCVRLYRAHSLWYRIRTHTHTHTHLCKRMSDKKLLLVLLVSLIRWRHVYIHEFLWAYPNERTNERTNEPMNEWMNDRTKEITKEWMMKKANRMKAIPTWPPHRIKH